MTAEAPKPLSLFNTDHVRRCNEALYLPYRQSADTARVRIGLVVPEGNLEQWVVWLAQLLGGIPGFDLVLLPFGMPPQSGEPGWLTDRLCQKARRFYDPFRKLDAKLLPTNAISNGSATGPESIAAARCDVLIWLAPRRQEWDTSAMAPNGAFTVRLGDGRRYPPFWNESIHGESTTKVTVFWHASKFTKGRMVKLAEMGTESGWVFTLNAYEPVDAVMRSLAALCLEIQAGGAAWRQDRRRLDLPEEEIDCAAKPSYPSLLESSRFAVRNLARTARKRRDKRRGKAEWFVALRGKRDMDPELMDLSGFQEVPLAAGSRVMADPFLLEYGGKTWLLFEEITTKIRLGRLCCAEILDNGSVADTSILLEKNYHLSYPCPILHGGELFLLPETCDARSIDLYRFRQFPSEPELVCSLAEGVTAVDTTPVLVDGIWYFFTTTVPYMETLLFWSPRLEGPLHYHPANPISTSVRNSRSAGHLFTRGSRLFRPVQDCVGGYGYLMSINEVTRLTPTEFQEHRVAEYKPTWMPGLLGTHTWNESSQYQVIDGLRLLP